MFLFEKYRPTNFNDFIFNKKIFQQLMHISSNEDIPHIILSGPPGGGKKTLIKFFLEALYDSDVNVLNKIKYNISGSSTKKEIEIMQSNYHIIIEPTNTNHDKYILQEIIRQYAMHRSFDIFKTKRKFKSIVIFNIENLANNSQSALRRTMELYAKTCRFIMVCNNLSKIFDPLRSRCRIFCVPLPTRNEISNVISYISIMENIQLPNKKLKHILDNSNNNLKKAIWILDCKRMSCNETITLDQVLNKVVNLLLSIKNMKNDTKNKKNVIQIFEKIRTNIYKIVTTTIKGSEIISIIMDKLIDKIDDDNINSKIIQFASKAEYNLIHGRRDIIDIDRFIASVMKVLRSNNKNLE